MLSVDRLLQIIEDWSIWMKKPAHKLGFPSKSLVMMSGGASTSDSFDELILAQDINNITIIDTLIHGLPVDQQEAIFYRYLSCKKPFAYEYKLEMAIDNLLTMASRKIDA
jgi:hypothetical protein